MQLYAGIDLHASNNFVAVIDASGKRVFKKKIPNEAEIILSILGSFKEEMTGVVVESTFNWYWLVDLLSEAGYRVHLANPCAIQKYYGLKHSDDKHDAFWLAEMLRLHILPEGYIYPKEERPMRDLLRKRGHLVRLRTSLILSLQNIVARNCGVRLNVNDAKRLKENVVIPLLESNDDLAMAGLVSKETIDFFTRKIWAVESMVEERVHLKDQYRHLLTIPGIEKSWPLPSCWRQARSAAFPRWATMCPTAAK
ncbi:MAG: transposase [Syntrophobacteraceae bacterium]